MQEPSWAALEPFAPQSSVETELIERSFVRVFATNEGARVMADLRARFLDCRFGPAAPDSLLRHAEGRREVIGYILDMIERGRK